MVNAGLEISFAVVSHLLQIISIIEHPLTFQACVMFEVVMVTQALYRVEGNLTLDAFVVVVDAVLAEPSCVFGVEFAVRTEIVVR